jgi:predicted RNA methylase
MFAGLEFFPERFVFVDLGSGKGRVLCLAAEFPFKEIIGVELSPELNAIAHTNLRVFSPAWRRCDRIRTICRDAAEFSFPEEPLMVFMFNPFGPVVLQKVLHRLEASLAAARRAIHVLYYQPLHETVFASSEAFARIRAAPDWVVYSARPVG